MTARQLIFLKPGNIEIREIKLKEPSADEVLVRALFCGLSTGTERLAYNGDFPESLLLDESIDELLVKAEYPFSYGYILIGEVQKAGSKENEHLAGRRVLVFHPHQDAAVVNIKRLIFLPESLPPEICVLVPNCETALTFILDSAPLMGENVCLYGLGLVGQIAARMLSSFPLGKLILTDPSEYRRNLALDIKPGLVVPNNDAAVKAGDFDLSFELSGNPEALQSAVNNASYDGRIIVGSWYGTKNVSLDLGTNFHRKRLSLISSQVSTIAPVLRGRWDFSRRMDTAVKWLTSNQNHSWITHTIPFDNASAAYEMINEPGSKYLQIVFDMK